MSRDLSIIIPTFRRKESLQRLLRTLLGQQQIVPEIIVIDQNQPGYLTDILAEFSSVKHILLPAPNASDARNQGFLASMGEIVLFIDDDLIPEPDFCSRALVIFRTHPTIQCFSPLVYNAEGQELALQQARSKYTGSLKEDETIFAITDTISAAIFFRRDYYIRTGGFDPALFEFARTAEDQELFLRMQKKGLTLYFVPQVQVYHDETIPGGCELRTADYWISREKCMKAWAFRYRIHHDPPGKLSVKDLFLLARSGFLNREVLTSGIKGIMKQARLLSKSIKASNEFLRARLSSYLPMREMDHLKQR